MVGAQLSDIDHALHSDPADTPRGVVWSLAPATSRAGAEICLSTRRRNERVNGCKPATAPMRTSIGSIPATAYALQAPYEWPATATRDSSNSKSDVTAVLLPTAALTLNLPMPPGRALIDKGAIVALATDFNPGSSPCDSLPAVMHLACTQLHLSPAEALTAVTANAAHVLELEDVGRLRVGQRADIVIVDAPDWRYLAYRLGTNAVKRVIVDGSEVYEA